MPAQPPAVPLTSAPIGEQTEFPSFSALADARAASEGDRPFLQLGDQTLSFAEFGRLTDRVAARLAELGVRPGDPVAVMLPNSIEFVLAWFGILKAGGAIVPINIELLADGLAHVLRHPQAALLIVHAGLLANLPADLPSLRRLVILPDESASEPAQVPAGLARQLVEVLPFDDLLGGHAARPVVALGPNDPCQIMYSSGTTGYPRGVLRYHGIELAKAALAGPSGLGPADVFYANVPLFHGLGLNWIQMALWARARVRITPGFSASRFWPEVRRYGCTGMTHVGTILPILLQASPRPDDREHPMRVTFGVGASAPLWRAFQSRFGVQPVEFYGSTETGLIAFNAPPGRPGSVGKVLPRVQVRLIDAAGQAVAPGEVGELLVRPARPEIPAPAYYRDPEATAASQLDGWWRTGDLVHADAEGFYYYVGRSKDTIRRGGKNIVPDDVERVINSHPAVLESAAVAVPSELAEDEVKVCVVLRPGQSATPAELVDHCTGRLAGYAIPRFIELRASLPKTSTEKIQRQVLRAEGRPTAGWDRLASGAGTGAGPDRRTTPPDGGTQE